MCDLCDCAYKDMIDSWIINLYILLCSCVSYWSTCCYTVYCVCVCWAAMTILIYKCIITVTSWWARLRLKSPASRLFTQSFFQAQIKENIKAPRHWALWGWESTGDRWSSHTKGQQRGKCFHLITSSWCMCGRLCGCGLKRLIKESNALMNICQAYTNGCLKGD